MAGDSVLWENLRATNWLLTHPMRTVAVQPPAYRYALSPICLYNHLPAFSTLWCNFPLSSAVKGYALWSVWRPRRLGVCTGRQRAAAVLRCSCNVAEGEPRGAGEMHGARETCSSHLAVVQTSYGLQLSWICFTLHWPPESVLARIAGQWGTWRRHEVGKRDCPFIYRYLDLHTCFVWSVFSVASCDHPPFVLVLQMLFIALSSGLTLTSPWKLKCLFPMTWWKAQQSR